MLDVVSLREILNESPLIKWFSKEEIDQVVLFIMSNYGYGGARC